MIGTMQPMTVVETRKRPRFLMREEIRATFSGAPAVVINLSAEGLAGEVHGLFACTGKEQVRLNDGSAHGDAP